MAEHYLWKCQTATMVRLVCLMLCMVVASVGAVKCQGVKEQLCLKLLVLTDQELDKVL